ncbi:hypothetical protein H257_05893 [Aphanomyces astaci]|uniref:Uncharacterized protein n=1 Tax=Aphanomyces astaci TaxID=112090 RepID=W4GR35_APHAT|nr:hypothetical protein H257_05893 [Aphanomyces astaci]ETV81348.1 hypothetical protein H257_05893 [Aphanomyces astaci]|eukprot:XP_009829206.1 hypothetical protein H257_05893 [Aphanomyces astaci]
MSEKAKKGGGESWVQGDALDRELASLKQTISLCNPIFQGHVNDWQSTSQVNQAIVDTEKALFAAPAKPSRASKKVKLVELDRSFNTTPLAKDKDIAILLAQAHGPPAASSGGIGSRGNNPDDGRGVDVYVPSAAAASKPVPKAKRMHMDGILHGLPVASNYKLTTTTTDHFAYNAEMSTMNRDKDTSHFRKRDSYSEYVEARARFSKMHSVT